MASETWDEIFDAVVVGSGATGLTGALVAAGHGLSTLVVEKDDQWGGTSAWSGGVVWAPGNSLQRGAGIADSPAEAASFLDEIVPEDGIPLAAERRRAFLENAPKMVDALIAAGIRWAVDFQPDYKHTSRTGARRGLDAEIFDARLLGPWQETLNRPPVPFAVTIREVPGVALGFSSLRSISHILRILARDFWLRRKGRDPVATGASLVAQLLHACLRRNVDVRLGHDVVELVHERGRIAGVVIRSKGEIRRIAARRGVMLCSGGFARSDDLRKQYQGTDGNLSCAAPGDTGDFVSLTAPFAPMSALMEHSWWATALKFPNELPAFFHWERALPHGLVVDQAGKRFANEAQDYASFGDAMVAHGVSDAWLIMDARHRNRYVFGGMMPRFTPRWALDRGMLIRADTLDDLASKCGIDARTLAKTVDRFNGFARIGADPDFARGETPYETYWGDPSVKPNPNLGTVENAPFFAARFYLTDIGTRGGLLTDLNAQVLNREGTPIPGLYAAGNAVAAILGRSYPGPGATLGPGMTWAYLAATQIAHPPAV